MVVLIHSTLTSHDSCETKPNQVVSKHQGHNLFTDVIAIVLRVNIKCIIKLSVDESIGK